MLDPASDILSGAFKGLSDLPATHGGDGATYGARSTTPSASSSPTRPPTSPSPGRPVRVWQLTGLLCLVGGFLGNAGASIARLLFGIGTLAMIWSAAPAGGRSTATGLAALVWALASIFALRGLTLRPIVHNHPPQYQLNPDPPARHTPLPYPGRRRPLPRQPPPAPALTAPRPAHHPRTQGNPMKPQPPKTELWASTLNGSHDGLPAKVTATHDDTRPRAVRL
ncbi:hypothetical protein [Streptomyces roseus]|uniref:hypothetical protein n=1 Tax=Streptomyces roseus TaxID=66430 RepID=UPI000AAD069E|nr:hypothetical protein [Streptomyces roseus]